MYMQAARLVHWATHALAALGDLGMAHPASHDRPRRRTVTPHPDAIQDAYCEYDPQPGAWSHRTRENAAA